MAKVLRMPRMLGGRAYKEDEKPEYAGYDAEIECMMACVEELSRLEGRKGAPARNAVMEYLLRRFDREDQASAEAAQPINTGRG